MNHCGKMKLLLSSLLLCSLCAPSSWSASPDVAVEQTPDFSVLEEEAVNITCCWKNKIERTRVEWLKNHTIVKNDTKISKEPTHQPTNCSTLIFPRVTVKDSGRYLCRITVEIPFFCQAEGNGTIITVTTREARDDRNHQNIHESGLPKAVIISLGVVVPLFLVALICFCSLKKNSAQAVRVIYEVPHIDSETIAMDKHSTGSSRDSSQWCYVDVYESVDYFQHVKDKGSE